MVLKARLGKQSQPRSWVLVMAVGLFVAWSPVEAASQLYNPSWEARKQRQYLLVNGVVHGTTAGLAALLRDEPFVPSFARGFGGGAMAFAGKWIAVDPTTGAGLVGRQVASVGSSITGNMVAGRGSFDRVALSVGPLRAYVGSEVDYVHWKLDLPALGVALWAALDGGSLDLGESLSHGSLVFRGDRNFGLPGTISFQPGSPDWAPEEILAHEQVHVIQFDQSFLSLGGPIEDRLAERFPALRGTLNRTETNLPILALTTFLAFGYDYSRRPWEKEAFLLGSLGPRR